jgi:upstream activation factor subunit UAF30
MPRKTTMEKKLTKESKDAKTAKAKTSKSKDAKAAKAKAKAAKAKASKAAKVAKVVKDKATKVEEPDVSDCEGVANVEETKKIKKRLVPTKETVATEFTDLVGVIEEEIVRLRESPGKAKGVKFLRSLGKKVKILRGHAVRVMKQKQKTNRKNNTNSGFLKPVIISKDMAKFTGWDPDELRSRVDVTKYICKYIRENDLQNPDDRRQILADQKLAKLLEYSADNDEKPLTYYRIQTYMKKHFTNPPKIETHVK